MDPGTGNVYTDLEAKALGLDPSKLVELDPGEAGRILEERMAEAVALEVTPMSPMSGRDKARRRARNKAARRSRKANR
jgi:hypothetical protein